MKITSKSQLEENEKFSLNLFQEPFCSNELERFKRYESELETCRRKDDEMRLLREEKKKLLEGLTDEEIKNQFKQTIKFSKLIINYP